MKFVRIDSFDCSCRYFLHLDIPNGAPTFVLDSGCATSMTTEVAAHWCRWINYNSARCIAVAVNSSIG